MPINVGGIYADLDINTGNLDRGLREARIALQACDREVEQLNEELRRGTILAADHAARMAALTATITGLTTRMQAAYSATTTLHTGLELVNRNAGQMGRSAGQMAMGFMQVGYAIDDLQYGFRGVINNVAPLASSIGASMGFSVTATAQFATGVQIAAVAAYQLYENWDLVTEAMGFSVTRTEAEEMERLAKATKLTADEQERLNRYKREQKVSKDLAEKQSEAVENTQKAVESVIAELGDESATGRTKLINGLIASRRGRGEGEQISDKEKEQLEIIRRGFGGTKYGQQLEEKLNAKIQARRDEEDVRRAAHTVDTSVFDPLRRKELINEIRANPSQFPEGALEDFEGMKPELTKKQKKENAALEKAEREAAQKSRADDSAHQRAVGRLRFLEEKAEAFGVSDDEVVELTRLRQEDSEKKGREAKQKARENLRAGLDAAPGGLKQQAEAMALMGMMGGISSTEAMQRIQAELQRNGATAEQAKPAAKEILDDATKKAQSDVTNRLMAGEQSKTSDVFDANSLAAQFQSSVGDENKKQTSLLEKLEKQVADLARAGFVKFERVK